jgi:hypothetical protein
MTAGNWNQQEDSTELLQHTEVLLGTCSAHN